MASVNGGVLGLIKKTVVCVKCRKQSCQICAVYEISDSIFEVYGHCSENCSWFGSILVDGGGHRVALK